MWIDWAKMYNKGKEVVKLHGSAAREKEKPTNWLNCCFLRAKYSDGIWKLTSCVWNNTCWICARDLKAMRAIKTHTHKRTTTAFSIPLTHIYFTRLDNISLMVQSEGGVRCFLPTDFWFTFIPFELSVKKHHSTAKQCQTNRVIIHLQCKPFFFLLRSSQRFFIFCF